MFIVILVILFYFIKNLFCYKEYYKLSSGRNEKLVSVCILNYKRPHNLSELVKRMSIYPNIKEILIFHGHPNYYIEIKHPLVQNFQDYEDNNKYGAGRRFLHYTKCNCDIILLLDDDLVPSQEWFNTGLKQIKNNNFRETIYGSYKRNCNKTGYNTNGDGFILTGCCFVLKKTLENFVKNNYFEKTKIWLETHKGNCEDLIFNLYIQNILKNKPIYIKGRIYQLDTTNGYSSSDGHYKLRDNFCKNYFNYDFKNKMALL